MEKNIRERQASLGFAAGGAEAVRQNLSSLRINVDVYLDAEDFRAAFVAELQEFEDRMQKIFTDLHNLSRCVDPDAGWGDERHRLANRGAEPKLEAVAA